MPACEMCSRKGVLIYPVRYAVACPVGAAGVPGLAGNFKIDGAPSNAGAAKYTLRSMRAGYMYVYDEVRKRLRAYMVMPQGLLWNFPIEHLPPPPASVKFGCTNPAEVTFGRCIDIVHTQDNPATNVWIGWSSVVWTKALFAKVADLAWRQKHMQCIDVTAMLGGTAAHTGEFAGHQKQIAHFAISKAAMLKAFAFSNTPVDREVSQRGLAALIGETMAAHAPYKKGYVIALNDPVGMTNDISELTLPTVDAGFDEDIARGKMVYDMLTLSEKSIKEDARGTVVYRENVTIAAKHTKGDLFGASRLMWNIFKAGGSDNYDKKIEAEKKKYGDSQIGRQNAAADQAWLEAITEEKNGKRVPLLDEARFKAFPDTYTKAINAFQPTNEKLARLHAAWLTSEQLANWMDGVHDRQDIRSGYAFSESLAQCIGKGVSSEPCSRQLLTWLDTGTVSDPRNLYVRALLFNHEDIIRATESEIKGSDIQFENILNIYKFTLIRLDKGYAAKLLDRLALATANIIVRAIQKGTSGGMAKIALLHLTLIGQTHLTVSTNTHAQLAHFIMDQVRQNGIQLSETPVQNFGSAHRTAGRVLRNITPDSGAIALSVDTENLRRLGIITDEAVTIVKIPGLDLAKKWLGSAVPREFHLGVVTTIVQMLALAFVAQDLVKSDSQNRHERTVKGISAFVGLSAAILETVASTLAKAPGHPLASFLPFQWAHCTSGAKRVASRAAYVGWAAGVVVGLYDIFINGLRAFADELSLKFSLPQVT